jgi:hypothetical protein
MGWGSRHDQDGVGDAFWDLTEGYLRHEGASGATDSSWTAASKHAPSGEVSDDDGAGNPLPREAGSPYAMEDGEADDWTRANSDEASF